MEKDPYDLTYIIGLILFPIIFMIIPPYIHEMWHVLFLKIFGCSYDLIFRFSIINGLKGIIDYSCSLERFDFIILKLAGTFGDIFIGMILYTIGWLLGKKNFLCSSILTTMFGITFFFYSSFSFINKELDLIDVLNLLNLNKLSTIFPMIGIFIGFSSMFMFWKVFKYTSEAKVFHKNIQKTFKRPKVR